MIRLHIYSKSEPLIRRTESSYPLLTSIIAQVIIEMRALSRSWSRIASYMYLDIVMKRDIIFRISSFTS